jgi:predicted 3-demethylubiquinone-9 3-methyltransferase (glyoxalase superfamily)
VNQKVVANVLESFLDILNPLKAFVVVQNQTMMAWIKWRQGWAWQLLPRMGVLLKQSNSFVEQGNKKKTNVIMFAPS